MLAERFPETTETQPELLAHHYTEAGLIAQAIPYWQQAGARAAERSAHMEAIGHLTKGLELLLGGMLGRFCLWRRLGLQEDLVERNAQGVGNGLLNAWITSLINEVLGNGRETDFKAFSQLPKAQVQINE